MAPLLLVSDGVAIAPLLLLSAGAIAGAAGAGGGVVSELLHAVSMTAVAARALRASFVFIDESPNWYEMTELKLRVQTSLSGACDSPFANSIDNSAYFKLPRFPERHVPAVFTGALVSAWRAGRGSR
jgi:hypothetical protein